MHPSKGLTGLKSLDVYMYNCTTYLCSLHQGYTSIQEDDSICGATNTLCTQECIECRCLFRQTGHGVFVLPMSQVTVLVEPEWSVIERILCDQHSDHEATKAPSREDLLFKLINGTCD